MATLEETVRRLTQGFDTEAKVSGGRERLVGEKKTGFFEKDQRVLVVTLKNAPTSQDLDWFFKEAERFCRDNEDLDVVGVYLLTPSEVDKAQFKSLRSRTEEEYAEKIKPPRTYEAHALPPSAPPPSLRAEAATARRRPEDSDSRLGVRSPRERVLYEWEMVYSEASQPPVPVVAVVTQERCVLFQRVGANLLALGVEIRWDQVTHVEAAIIDGSPVVNINDGKRIHHLHHTDAPYIARLIHHLHWTRQGYLTGFAELYEWDTGLLEAIRQPLLGSRYPAALRDGFAHVEAEIRDACNLPEGTVTKDTLNRAFNPGSGLFTFGRNPGEQEGLFHFVTGAFGLFRNAPAHEAGGDSLDLRRTIQALNIANSILTLLSRGNEAARQRPLIKPHEPAPPRAQDEVRNGV